MEHKLNVVIFSGGRGTATISDAITRHPQISLFVLVNTYDDGKSTGAIRRFVPGMLGPSDVRKNISHLMAANDRSDQALKTLLEHRLPQATTLEQGMGILQSLAERKPPLGDSTLCRATLDLRLEQVHGIAQYAQAFLDYLQVQVARGRTLPMGDCSIGNLLFGGAYLLCGQDFNRAVEDLSRFCNTAATILNITDGENAVLVGLKENGEYLEDECSIVSAQSDSPIRDIFLLRDYLSPQEKAELAAKTVDEKHTMLGGREFFPRLNPAVREVLSNADIIIYGPGTQHSSLFPSYVTQEVGRLIAANRSAEKVFISNLLKDHEIQGETANSLFRKLTYYLNAKGRTAIPCGDLVSVSFLQAHDCRHDCEASYVECNPNDYPFAEGDVICSDWQDQQGHHFGGRVLDEILSMVNDRLDRKVRSLPYMVSVIVPGLNEERTVRQVLRQLSLLDFQRLGISKEIIYVDGGSTDRSLELARSVRNVRVYTLPGKGGRGAALRYGAEKATGNILAFFPSDGEYDVNGLMPAVQLVVRSGYQIIFGSRLIKCLALSQMIRQIYGRNYFTYLVSKYGGIVMSICTLLFYSRYVSDILTSVKVFDAHTFRRLGLKGNTVDLDAEIVAKASQQQVFILEVPIDFAPRTRKQGKKIRMVDGLKALAMLVRHALPSGWRSAPANAEPAPAVPVASPAGGELEFDYQSAAAFPRIWPLLATADQQPGEETREAADSPATQTPQRRVA